MKRFLKLYGIEQKMFFRSGDVFIFNLCMPVVTLITIVLIAGNKSAGVDMTYLDSAFASLITVGICCSAFMSIPIVFVPQVLVFSLLCTYLYRRTGNVYTGAFTVASMAAWIITGGSVIL